MSDGKTLSNKPVDPVTGQVPSATEVRKQHTNADTDGGEGSIHHTLGPRKGQSAPGDHDHRGGSSALLLDGFIINGTKAGNTAIAGIIAALVELGATDSTLP